MKGMKGGLLALTALTLIGVGDIAAQEEVESLPERAGMRGSASAERIMSMRERLELTEEQIASLDEIRAEDVERRSTSQAEIAEMRSRMMAGQIRRSEMMAFMEDRQAGFANIGDDRRRRVEGILTAGQLEALGTMRDQSRTSRRGRGWSRSRGAGTRGRGFRGAPGARGSRSMMRGRAPGAK